MIVEDLLNREGITFTLRGNDYLVNCLNPEHEDNNPSMRIDKVTGIFNCFSCGYKGNIFTLHNETPNELQLRRELFKKLLSNKITEDVGLSRPISAIDYVGDWRGINPETYIRFGAFTSVDSEFRGRIVFPITDFSGRVKAFVGRSIDNSEPRYYIHPRNASMPLFPHVKPINGRVILVEGLFDLLRLHDNGLNNAVCAFGTNGVTGEKLRLLKISGASHVDVFFDGDEAGQSASKKVKDLCDQEGLIYRNIFVKDKDPGELSNKAITTLMRKLYGTSSDS